MPYYAHALIEHGTTKYQRGQELPDDLPGLADLVEFGSAGAQEPTSNVVLDSQNRIVETLHPDGITVPNTHVKCFDGDFTGDEIDDPAIDTPLAATHHPAPTAHDNGEAGA